MQDNPLYIVRRRLEADCRGRPVIVPHRFEQLRAVVQRCTGFGLEAPLLVPKLSAVAAAALAFTSTAFTSTAVLTTVSSAVATAAIAAAIASATLATAAFTATLAAATLAAAALATTFTAASVAASTPPRLIHQVCGQLYSIRLRSGA